MAPSRTIVAWLVIVLGLGALALHPVSLVERALDWLLLPTRACAELASPIGWFQSREVGAAEEDRKEAMRRELFEHEALEEAVLDSAIAPRSEKHPRADFVHAEVTGRSLEEQDVLLARVEDASGLEPGMPVVSGDWFVGLVHAVPREALEGGGPAEVEIALVTGSHSRIAGVVREGPAGSSCELVLGGIAPPRDRIHLDVHQPSQRWVHEGRVEVEEPESLGEPHTSLANGYQLGELVLATFEDEQGGPRSVPCVRPGLDYEAGLYQVLVLVPRGRASSSAARREDPLRDGRWASARSFLRSETSSWREGRKLALGLRHGVEEGAALVSGVRLVGRVVHAGPYWSDARMLGDPGLSLVAIAMVEEAGDLRPHVLGRIVSRGRASDGSIRFEWTATLPLGGAGEHRSRLWTGSGEHGVPRGLLLGDAALPSGPGTHEIRLVQPSGAREPKALAVRLATEGAP